MCTMHRFIVCVSQRFSEGIASQNLCVSISKDFRSNSFGKSLV